jgi:O-antigen ligase
VARLLVVCIFLPERFQVFAAIATCIYFVFRTFACRQWPQTSVLLWALLLGSGYLLYVFALPLTDMPYRSFVYTLCERRASYFLLPFVFAITSAHFRDIIKQQLIFFAYACIVVCVLGNGHFLYQQYVVDGGLQPLSHVRYRTIFEPFTGIHPTYMSMYLAFAICITLLRNANTLRERIVRNTIAYTLFVFMLALFAKSPLIALVLISIHFLWVQRHVLGAYKPAFIALAGIVGLAWVFIPFFRQRATEMLGMFQSGEGKAVVENSVHARKLIWNTDITMLQHYWLVGAGPGRSLDLLHQRYFFNSIHRGFWVGYFDPHNQYLSDWLSFGLVGILFLVVVLVVQFAKAVRARNQLYLYLLIIISTTFFTETLLARQQGVLFYSIFTALLFFTCSTPQKNNTKV